MSNGIGYAPLCNPTGEISICLNCKAPVCVLDKIGETPEERTAYLPEYIAFGEAVKQAREKAHMTRPALAEKCGAERHAWQNWENGERAFPAEIRHKLELIFPELEAFDNETKHV